MVSCFNPRDYIRFHSIRKFTTLNLTYHTIGTKGARYLAKILQKDSCIQSLQFGGNQIGNQGAEAIADAIRSNHNITDLRLGDNQIGDEGMIAIAQAIKANPNIEQLYLDHNFITDRGVKELIDCLIDVQNKSLVNICLCGNQISDEGACAFATFLRQNRSLCSLDLGNNKIGNKGAEALAKAFRDSYKDNKLETLILSQNSITVLPVQFAQCGRRISNFYFDNNPNLYIPPNLNRSLKLSHNLFLYHWRQSLKQNSRPSSTNSKVWNNLQPGVISSVSSIMNRKPIYENFREVKNAIFDDSILSAECKNRLLQYSQDNYIHPILNVSFKELLPAVFSCINEHSHRDEIKSNLNLEMENGLCIYPLGRIVRLLYCLVNYDKDVIMRESLILTILKKKGIPSEIDWKIYEYLIFLEVEPFM